MKETLTYLFIQTVKKHSATMRGLLAEKDLYPGQPSLLRALSEKDGQSQKELAAVLSNKAATITVMLKRMEKSGLVRRIPDPEDQRITRVFITDKGREAYLDVQESLRVMEHMAFRYFSEEELQQFRVLLGKMSGNLDQLDHPGNFEQSTVVSERVQRSDSYK